ncbi:MAG TPA: sigma 54-interacting transcriptional regulator [Syntrophales bacterium]|nr:sigma 54-interacting transcriptional regulator [Syntrophales bacterium]
MGNDDLLKLKQKIRLYEAVLNNIRSGVLITDPQGYITFFSEAYGKFLKKDPREQIGKHCTDVVENTRMHIVAQTGIPEINWPHHIMDQDMIVQRIPIFVDGVLEAVFGQVMFEDVRDLQTVARRLELLETKVKLYEKELQELRSSRYTIENIIGKSDGIKALKKFALKAAVKNAPVLLVGESGTGKELFAHAIHHASERRPFPFIRVNCAAIPRDLLEAELFGYEPGAFTGAGSKGKAGKFELAHRGTIFLDEVSELPLEMQPKLLRVLEDKEIEKLGSTGVMRCDFRLVAATSHDLEHMVEQGKFRKELFYRLYVVPIQIPPLRERKEDIPLLANHIISHLAKELGANIKGISDEVMKIFQSYDWPGNVRELSNALERSLYSVEGHEEMLRVEHLPIYLRGLGYKVLSGEKPLLKDLKDDSEREALLHALKTCGYNVIKTAQTLGIHRTTLYKKAKKLNLPLAGS